MNKKIIEGMRVHYHDHRNEAHHGTVTHVHARNVWVAFDGEGGCPRLCSPNDLTIDSDQRPRDAEGNLVVKNEASGSFNRSDVVAMDGRNGQKQYGIVSQLLPSGMIRVTWIDGQFDSSDESPSVLTKLSMVELIHQFLRDARAETSVNVPGGAIKHDLGKQPLDLLDPGHLLAVADVMKYGAEKYEAENWRKGLPARRLFAAAMRHLLAWQRGENDDPESGLPHLDHAAANVMMLSATLRDRPDLDDRWGGGAS